ncbi:tetratricopeptide repeat protein [Caballeronia sp. M23-90]
MNQLAEPYARAFSHHQAGQMAEAESGYRQVLQQRPDHVDALHHLGVLLHQRGEDLEAAKLLDRALGLALDAST